MGMASESLPALSHHVHHPRPPGKHHYVRLSSLEPSADEAHLELHHGARCMRVSRFRLATILVTSLLMLIMVLYASVMPTKNGTQTHTGTPLATTTLPAIRLHSEENTRIRYKHTKRRLPQCLIIGARKAGTRALLTFLDLHPQIRTAKNEVHFFDDDDNYMLGLEWYRKKMPFSFPGQVTLEKTPAYFTYNYVPERVYRMNQTIKLLLIVRDPVDRAVSDYLQIHSNKVQKNKPDLPFEEHAIDEYGNVVKSYNPVERSLYFRFMGFWLQYFSLEQFLIMSGENLIKNPLLEIKRVEKFLGLDSRITKDNFFYNQTRGFYCIRNETAEKCLADSKGRMHPKINPLVLQKLRNFYRPYNHKFYQQIGVDMGWS